MLITTAASRPFRVVMPRSCWCSTAVNDGGEMVAYCAQRLDAHDTFVALTTALVKDDDGSPPALDAR